MEVASEGEIRADEPTTRDFQIYPGVQPPSPESCVHDQTPDVPSLLRLWRGIRLTGGSRSRYGRYGEQPLTDEPRSGELRLPRVAAVVEASQPQFSTCGLSCADAKVCTCHSLLSRVRRESDER